MTARFWESKRLGDMTPAEWDALCDGCARCCVYKYEDEATGVVDYTQIACRYLDLETCRCTCYTERARLRPDCVHLSVESPECFGWLPETCAYRRLFEGKTLPIWHPLVTGRPNSTHRAGMSARQRVVSEEELGERLDEE